MIVTSIRKQPPEEVVDFARGILYLERGEAVRTIKREFGIGVIDSMAALREARANPTKRRN
jgi:hypothetical protein